MLSTADNLEAESAAAEQRKDNFSTQKMPASTGSVSDGTKKIRDKATKSAQRQASPTFAGDQETTTELEPKLKILPEQQTKKNLVLPNKQTTSDPTFKSSKSERKKSVVKSKLDNNSASVLKQTSTTINSSKLSDTASSPSQTYLVRILFGNTSLLVKSITTAHEEDNLCFS